MTDNKGVRDREKRNSKPAQELFSVVSDILGINVVGNIVFLHGRNATGKTLAINMVKGMTDYYGRVHGCPVKPIYVQMDTIACDGPAVSHGERIMTMLETALSRTQSGMKYIVLIDNFSLIPDNHRADILKIIQSKIKMKLVDFALIGLLSNEAKLRIQIETK